MRFPFAGGKGRPESMKPCRGAALAAAGSILLSGCAVGPDFQKPAPPPVSTYTAQPPVAGEPQQFAPGADIQADWWTLFHSATLNNLIAEALKNNHDLKAAQAALKVAAEHRAAQQGAFFPTVTGGFAATRQQQPGSLAPVPSNNAFTYDLFTPQVAVSYMPDVFGLNRRTVESLEAQEQGARYQLAAAYTTLINNLVSTLVQIAATQDQIDATRQMVADNERMVEILRDRLSHGYASGADLAAQETQRAQMAASLPPLIKQQTQLRDLLAVLVGRYTPDAPQDRLTLSDLKLPDTLPLSLPSAMVAQRPDVLQAEANMHDASAQIGVAVANRLPNITLSANAGSTALAINQVFGPGTSFWSLGSNLAATIFDGNALLHQERAARAAYDQAAEQYRGTVLTAFQNVADTLVALQQDGDGLKQAAAAENAARVSLEATRQQVQDGYAAQLALLNAEQAYLQTRIATIQAEADRYTDTAALFQALGGGWWHRPELNGDKDAN
jgi:NodT family efflux transporter outer membrane factor (OMF) lipoprotein